MASGSFAAETAATAPVAKTPARAAKAPVRKHKPVRKAQATPAAAARGRHSVTYDLALKSGAALVIDQDTGETVALKNADEVRPIASLTKLMTGLVVVEAKQPMDEVLEITDQDVDAIRHTYSRLVVGTKLTRENMLLLALMSSENRAAMALSRNYPGGRPAFIAQMNRKARELGMNSTHYADPAGLSNDSVSTARDLHKLVTAAYAQPLIRADTTQTETLVKVRGRLQTFVNSNSLVRGSGDWDIRLQKTGFTNEAGRCLVMQVNMLSRRLAMIFLDSNGKMTRYADAARILRMIQLEDKGLLPSTRPQPQRAVATASAAAS